MTDAQAQKFVAALDKIDIALLAIRMEFEEQVRISNERLAELKAREHARNFAATSNPIFRDCEVQPA